MQCKFLYIVIIILLLIELYKLYDKLFCENFSSSPTNFVISKTEESSLNDVFLIENQEELVGIQIPNKDRQWLFNYIRIPLGRYIGIYVKKVKNDDETIINSFLIKNTYNNNKILNLFGLNNMLIQDNSATYRYYIKVLNQNQYNRESLESEKIKAQRNKYLICVNNYLGSMSRPQAVEKCKTTLL